MLRHGRSVGPGWDYQYPTQQRRCGSARGFLIVRQELRVDDL